MTRLRCHRDMKFSARAKSSGAVGLSIEGDTLKYAELQPMGGGRWRIGLWDSRRFGAVQETTVPEGETASENQFQAITGASYSTGAIKSIVNSTLQAAQNRIKS